MPVEGLGWIAVVGRAQAVVDEGSARLETQGLVSTDVVTLGAAGIVHPVLATRLHDGVILRGANDVGGGREDVDGGIGVVVSLGRNCRDLDGRSKAAVLVVQSSPLTEAKSRRTDT